MKTILYFQSSLCASNNAELDGVYRYAKSARWRVQVVPYGEAAGGRLHADEESAKPNIGALMEFWRPDGVIVDCGAAPGLLGPSDFRRTPTVFLDRSNDQKALCVYSDSEEIAACAAKELLSLDCAAYTYIPWMENLDWSRDRGEAFARIVRMNGRKCHIFRPRTFGHEDDTYRAWLKEWLEKAPKPLGVFAANDYIAAQVLSCATVARIAVPDELRVIGVDNDLQICVHTAPPLTSILPDHEKAGFFAAELLADRLAHPKARLASRTFGPVAVIHRQSTNAIRRHDDRVGAALELIRRRACEGLMARDVIAAMGTSRRLAELRFREVTGRSILEEIKSVRLERAKNLLRKTDTPVAEIAAACGYGSTEALRKIFIAEFGAAPARWRKGKARSWR